MLCSLIGSLLCRSALVLECAYSPAAHPTAAEGCARGAAGGICGAANDARGARPVRQPSAVAVEQQPPDDRRSGRRRCVVLILCKIHHSHPSGIEMWVIDLSDLRPAACLHELFCVHSTLVGLTFRRKWRLGSRGADRGCPWCHVGVCGPAAGQQGGQPGPPAVRGAG